MNSKSTDLYGVPLRFNYVKIGDQKYSLFLEYWDLNYGGQGNWSTITSTVTALIEWKGDREDFERQLIDYVVRYDDRGRDFWPALEDFDRVETRA